MDKKINTVQKTKVSFLDAVKNSFKPCKSSKTFPWFQSGLILVGFAAGVFVTSGVDILSRFTSSEQSSQEISEDEKCREKGGRYDKESETCIIITSDRGGTCSDSSECQGWCLADENDELGQQEKGYCSDNFRPEGCFKFIDNGKVNSICMP